MSGESTSSCPPKVMKPHGIPAMPDGPRRERCVEIWHPGFDARFPNMNVTRWCWQNFVDFYRCQARLGEDDSRCEYYKKAFTCLCPEAWVEKWEDQRENGTFPTTLE